MATRWMLVLALVAGCDDTIAYHRVEFPGFALEVPSAMAYTGDPVSEYLAGSTQVISERNRRAAFVTWQPGALSTPEEMGTYAKALAAVMPSEAGPLRMGAASPTTVSGQPAMQVDGTIAGMRMLLVEVTCGKRSIQLAALAAKGVDAIMARMTTTFRCTPVVADEARVGGVPIGSDDPTLFAGFRRDGDPDIFSITNDQITMIFMTTPHIDRREEGALAKMIPHLFGEHGTWTNGRRETRTVAGRDRIFQHGTLTMDGEELAGTMVTWNCEKRPDGIVALAIALERSALDAAVDRLVKMRCSQPGDAPLALLPPAPAAEPPPEGPPPPTTTHPSMLQPAATPE